MTPCATQDAGLVELYFYDELPPAERQEVTRHLRSCAECRAALDELHAIRAALDERPRVIAPPSGDWSDLMTRLDRALAVEPARPGASGTASFLPVPTRRPPAAFIASAASVVLISAALAYQGFEHRPGRQDAPAAPTAARETAPAGGQGLPAYTDPALGQDAGFVAVSEEHFERSKLVILGLASRDARSVSSADWAYERQLAGSLLDDTRLYKQTAEARGLGALAGVMSDLELVLLQTSLTDEPDEATLSRLQRLIRQRDLVSKMEVTKWF